MKKKLLSLAIIALVMVPFLSFAYQAQALEESDLGITDIESSGIVLSDQDPITTATQIINTILLLLGIIAVAIVLMGGFKWMTAGGNDDKVSEAKKLIGAGVIGLVIILAAWGIAKFILVKLMDATGA
jgi:Zn-dependent protease with chaperone function